MSNQLTGKLIVKNETQQISDKFSKREFVIETQDTYPQSILFQLTQDKCALLDNAKVGDTLTVSFNLRGRGWTNPQGETKYFNTIEAWRIELSGTQPQAPKQQAQEEEDDLGLPF